MKALVPLKSGDFAMEFEANVLTEAEMAVAEKEYEEEGLAAIYHLKVYTCTCIQVLQP